MTATDHTLIPEQFRSALNAEPECFTLRLVIADWFAENDQSLAEECLRWTVEKRRVPNSYSTSKWWYWSNIGCIPSGMYTSEPFYDGFPTEVSRSVSNAFDSLIAGWLRSTPEQRQRWWDWQPEDQR